jgi:hypothetical protein
VVRVGEHVLPPAHKGAKLAAADEARAVGVEREEDALDVLVGDVVGQQLELIARERQDLLVRDPPAAVGIDGLEELDPTRFAVELTEPRVERLAELGELILAVRLEADEGADALIRSAASRFRASTTRTAVRPRVAWSCLCSALSRRFTSMACSRLAATRASSAANDDEDGALAIGGGDALAPAPVVRVRCDGLALELSPP